MTSISRLNTLPPGIRQPVRNRFQKTRAVNIVHFTSLKGRASRWEVFLCPDMAGHVRVFFQEGRFVITKHR